MDEPVSSYHPSIVNDLDAERNVADDSTVGQEAPPISASIANTLSDGLKVARDPAIPIDETEHLQSSDDDFQPRRKKVDDLKIFFNSINLFKSLPFNESLSHEDVIEILNPKYKKDDIFHKTIPIGDKSNVYFLIDNTENILRNKKKLKIVLMMIVVLINIQAASKLRF